MTATFLARKTGVSDSSDEASIRLTRVKYSLQDNTPLRFSPGIPMKRGNPAPLPTKTP